MTCPNCGAFIGILSCENCSGGTTATNRTPHEEGKKMTHEETAESITGPCSCTVEYTSSKLIDPSCQWHDNFFLIKDALDSLAAEKDKEIQELRGSLTVAVEYLKQIAQPALGGKLQQYAAQEALTHIKLKSTAKRIEAMERVCEIAKRFVKDIDKVVQTEQRERDLAQALKDYEGLK